MGASSPRHILLTGCTRGLGLALTEGLIREGHILSGCGRDTGALASLTKRHGAPHRFDRVDVCDEAAVADWVARAEEDHGAPDLVINNAGVIHPNAPLWELSADEVARVLEVNLIGVTSVLRHVLPAMISRGRGIIVNMSSGWGRSASPEVSVYCASKWGLEGLTQALAQELPAGLAAIALNPGVIDTDMLRSCFGGAAHMHPDPDTWARRAVPVLLGYTASDNGRTVSLS